MSKIEWTNVTWNPIVGCNKISLGCDNCYAEKMALRQVYIHQKRECGLNDTCLSYTVATNETGWSGKTSFNNSQLVKPLRWKKPRMIFVCSMGDLFHKSVPFAWIDQVFDIMAQTPRHTYQILTKRPDRMKQYFEHKNELLKDLGGYSPPPFIWLGVTAENQEQANKRVPVLLQIPASIHFVSIEPMLSNIFLDDWMIPTCKKCNGSGSLPISGGGIACPDCLNTVNGQGWLNSQIDWVICGGESGHKARPIHPYWVESIKHQCKVTKTPFFFKQWGAWIHKEQISDFDKIKDNFKNHVVIDNFHKLGKKKAGRLLDSKEHNEMPK